MLQSPGVELGQAELGLYELHAAFPWAPSPSGEAWGPGRAGGPRPGRVWSSVWEGPLPGPACAACSGDFLFREHLPQRGACCRGGSAGALVKRPRLPLCRSPASVVPPLRLGRWWEKLEPRVRGAGLSAVATLSCFYHL